MKTTNETQTTAYPFQFCHKAVTEVCENAKFKEKTAVHAGGVAYSYSKLRNDVLRLCAALSAKNLPHNAAIGLYIDPSYWTVVSLLAVWEIGAHFVSLNTDPEFGFAAVQSIIDTVKPHLIICMDNPFSQEQNVLLLRDLPENVTGDSLAELKTPHPSDLSYIAFTSGSTEEPKGIKIEHTGLYNCMRGYSDMLGITANDRLSWFAGVSFDAYIMEILISLLAGATLYIVPTASKRDANEIVAFYQQHQITVAIFTPSLLSVLNLDQLPAIHTITSTGEKLEQELLDNLLCRKNLRIFDGYGPAEVTIATSMGLCINVDQRGCGQALPGLEMLILEKVPSKPNIYQHCQHGDLFIAGVGLARGYFNNPALTAKRFPTIEIEGREGTLRVFNTKDIGFWDEFKNCHIIGRKGRQLKIHGQLYHPAPTEALLMKQTLVPLQRVYVHGVLNAQKYPVITVYCHPKTMITDTHEAIRLLHGYIREKLPRHHKPTLWAFVETLQLNVNMKIDAKKLITLDIKKHHLGHRLRKKPANDIEIKVAKIFYEVVDQQIHLGCEDPLTHVATSIQLLACLNRINDSFPLRLSFSDFITAPTIAAVARKIRGIPNTLVQLNEHFPIQPSTQPVLFMIHAVLGDALQDYSEFAKQWPGTMPVVGVQAPGLLDEDSMPCTMTELVAIYYQQIKKIQNKGPYFIAGRSAGGIIGHALAARLSTDSIVVLVAFDSDIKNFTSSSFADYILGLVNRYLGGKTSITRDQLSGLAHDEQVIRVFAELLVNPNLDTSTSKRLITVRNCILACISYQLKQPIPTMVLYTADETKRYHENDERLGWPDWQPINSFHYAGQTHDSLVDHPPVIQNCAQQIIEFEAYFAIKTNNIKLARLHSSHFSGFQQSLSYAVLKKIFPYLEGQSFIAASQVAASWYRVAREFISGRYIVPIIQLNEKCYLLGNALNNFLQHLSSKKVLLIDGPSGIGKSTTLSYIAEQLQLRGYPVLHRELGDYSVADFHQSLKREIAEWQVSAAEKHRFIILDAEDELGQLNFNHRLPNLYDKLKLKNATKTTLIISCRSEIFNQRYQYDFIPENNLNAFEEWNVLPLTRQQASLLLARVKNKAQGFAEKYYANLPGFIRENTLLLRYALQLSNELMQGQFNVLKLYQLLTEKYFHEWQSRKFTGESVTDTLAEDCKCYAENIALTLIGLQQKQLAPSEENTAQVASLLTADKLKLMKNIHINKTAAGYKFSHASFVGYYAATAIARELLNDTAPEALQTYFQRFAITPIKLVVDSHFVDFWRLISTDAINARLLKCMVASKYNPELAIIAGIAMTLANCNKMFFGNCDLSHTVIKDAVLDYGNYQGVNLFGSTFINVSMIGAILDRANLQKWVCQSVIFDTGTEFYETSYQHCRQSGSIIICPKSDTDAGPVKLQSIHLDSFANKAIDLKNSDGSLLHHEQLQNATPRFQVGIIHCLASQDGRQLVLLANEKNSNGQLPALFFEMTTGKLVNQFVLHRPFLTSFLSRQTEQIYYLQKPQHGNPQILLQSIRSGVVQNTLLLPNDSSTHYALNNNNILLTFNCQDLLDVQKKSNKNLTFVKVYHISDNLQPLNSIDLNLPCTKLSPNLCQFIEKDHLLVIAFSLPRTVEGEHELQVYDLHTKQSIFSTTLKDLAYAVEFGMIVYLNPRGYIVAEDIRSKRRLFQHLSTDERIFNFNIVKGGLGILYEAITSKHSLRWKTVFKPITENNYILGNRLQPGTVQDLMLQAERHLFQERVGYPLMPYDYPTNNKRLNDIHPDFFTIIWSIRNTNMHQAPMQLKTVTNSQFVALMIANKIKMMKDKIKENNEAETTDDLSPGTILSEHYHQLFNRLSIFSVLARHDFIINIRCQSRSGFEMRPNEIEANEIPMQIFDYSQGLRIIIRKNQITGATANKQLTWTLPITATPIKAWANAGHLCIVTAESYQQNEALLKLVCVKYQKTQASFVDVPTNITILGVDKHIRMVNSDETDDKYFTSVLRNYVSPYNLALNSEILAIQRNDDLSLYQVNNNFQLENQLSVALESPIQSIFFGNQHNLFIVSENTLALWNYANKKSPLQVVGTIPRGETIQSTHLLDKAVLLLSNRANHYLFTRRVTDDYWLSQRSGNLLSCNETLLDGCRGLSLPTLRLLKSKGASGYPVATELNLIDNNRQILNLQNARLGDNILKSLEHHDLSMLSIVTLSHNNLGFLELCDLLQQAQNHAKCRIRQLMIDHNRIHCGLIELETIIIPLLEKSLIIFCDLSMNFISDGKLLPRGVVPVSTDDDQRCHALLRSAHGFLYSVGSSVTSSINPAHQISQEIVLVHLSVTTETCVLSFEGVRESGQRFIRCHEFQLQARNVMTLCVRELAPNEWRNRAPQAVVSEALLNIPLTKITLLLQYFTDTASAEVASLQPWKAADWQLALVKWLNQLLSKHAVHLNQSTLNEWLSSATQSDKCCIC